MAAGPEDLTTPLLQLNPPVLVRTTGGDVATINLVALRRAQAGGGASAFVGSSPTGAVPAAPSLAARRLQDAKRAAQSVHQHARDGTAPSASGAARAQTLPNHGRKKGPLAGADTNGDATGARSAAAASTTSNAAQRWEADARQGTGAPVPPSPNTRSAQQREHTSAPGIATTTTTTPAVAAAAAAEGQQVSMSMPYLMRHIHDTGALLDTLFPVQPPQQQQQRGIGCGSSAASPWATAVDSDESERDSRGELVYAQTVSAAPSFREDVMQLHATLQARLEARRARPTGLCHIRRALYHELFSELVRQVTIEEPARGLVLARVREEAEHSLQVHAALLREGERFAAGKLLQDSHDAVVLQERLAALQGQKAVLEVRQHELLEACKEVEQRFEEERQVRHKQQQDELNYLRRANQQLSLRLKMETERESAAGEVDNGGETAAATAASTS
ncbi:Axonemal inner arm dynein light chain [Novymonas esmeraldas]|uniref:Axonemal inner arm dynein light chain n=1 Tax=Novymonas esmeraldas TaxID=1808958 RepID=A0AAW0EVG5_9TRYP